MMMEGKKGSLEIKKENSEILIQPSTSSSSSLPPLLTSSPPTATSTSSSSRETEWTAEHLVTDILEVIRISTLFFHTQSSSASPYLCPFPTKIPKKFSKEELIKEERQQSPDEHKRERNQEQAQKPERRKEEEKKKVAGKRKIIAKTETELLPPEEEGKNGKGQDGELSEDLQGGKGGKCGESGGGPRVSPTAGEVGKLFLSFSKRWWKSPQGLDVFQENSYTVVLPIVFFFAGVFPGANALTGSSSVNHHHHHHHHTTCSFKQHQEKKEENEEENKNREKETSTSTSSPCRRSSSIINHSGRGGGGDGKLASSPTSSSLLLPSFSFSSREWTSGIAELRKNISSTQEWSSLLRFPSFLPTLIDTLPPTPPLSSSSSSSSSSPEERKRGGSGEWKATSPLRIRYLNFMFKMILTALRSPMCLDSPPPPFSSSSSGFATSSGVQEVTKEKDTVAATGGVKQDDVLSTLSSSSSLLALDEEKEERQRRVCLYLKGCFLFLHHTQEGLCWMEERIRRQYDDDDEGDDPSSSSSSPSCSSSNRSSTWQEHCHHPQCDSQMIRDMGRRITMGGGGGPPLSLSESHAPLSDGDTSAAVVGVPASNPTTNSAMKWRSRRRENGECSSHAKQKKEGGEEAQEEQNELQDKSQEHEEENRKTKTKTQKEEEQEEWWNRQLILIGFTASYVVSSLKSHTEVLIDEMMRTSSINPNHNKNDEDEEGDDDGNGGHAHHHLLPPTLQLLSSQPPPSSPLSQEGNPFSSIHSSASPLLISTPLAYGCRVMSSSSSSSSSSSTLLLPSSLSSSSSSSFCSSSCLSMTMMVSSLRAHLFFNLVQCHHRLCGLLHWLSTRTSREEKEEQGGGGPLSCASSPPPRSSSLSLFLFLGKKLTILVEQRLQKALEVYGEGMRAFFWQHESLSPLSPSFLDGPTATTTTRKKRSDYPNRDDCMESRSRSNDGNRTSRTSMNSRSGSEMAKKEMEKKPPAPPQQQEEERNVVASKKYPMEGERRRRDVLGELLKNVLHTLLHCHTSSFSSSSSSWTLPLPSPPGRDVAAAAAGGDGVGGSEGGGSKKSSRRHVWERMAAIARLIYFYRGCTHSNTLSSSSSTTTTTTPTTTILSSSSWDGRGGGGRVGSPLHRLIFSGVLVMLSIWMPELGVETMRLFWEKYCLTSPSPAIRGRTSSPCRRSAEDHYYPHRKEVSFCSPFPPPLRSSSSSSLLSSVEDANRVSHTVDVLEVVNHMALTIPEEIISLSTTTTTSMKRRRSGGMETVEEKNIPSIPTFSSFSSSSKKELEKREEGKGGMEEGNEEETFSVQWENVFRELCKELLDIPDQEKQVVEEEEKNAEKTPPFHQPQHQHDSRPPPPLFLCSTSTPTIGDHSSGGEVLFSLLHALLSHLLFTMMMMTRRRREENSSLAPYEEKMVDDDDAHPPPFSVSSFPHVSSFSLFYFSFPYFSRVWKRMLQGVWIPLCCRVMFQLCHLATFSSARGGDASCLDETMHEHIASPPNHHHHHHRQKDTTEEKGSGNEKEKEEDAHRRFHHKNTSFSSSSSSCAGFALGLIRAGTQYVRYAEEKRRGKKRRKCGSAVVEEAKDDGRSEGERGGEGQSLALGSLLSSIWSRTMPTPTTVMGVQSSRTAPPSARDQQQQGGEKRRQKQQKREKICLSPSELFEFLTCHSSFTPKSRNERVQHQQPKDHYDGPHCQDDGDDAIDAIEAKNTHEYKSTRRRKDPHGEDHDEAAALHSFLLMSDILWCYQPQRHREPEEDYNANDDEEGEKEEASLSLLSSPHLSHLPIPPLWRAKFHHHMGSKMQNMERDEKVVEEEEGEQARHCPSPLWISSFDSSSSQPPPPLLLPPPPPSDGNKNHSAVKFGDDDEVSSSFFVQPVLSLPPPSFLHQRLCSIWLGAAGRWEVERFGMNIHEDQQNNKTWKERKRESLTSPLRMFWKDLHSLEGIRQLILGSFSPSYSSFSSGAGSGGSGTTPKEEEEDAGVDEDGDIAISRYPAHSFLAWFLSLCHLWSFAYYRVDVLLGSLDLPAGIIQGLSALLQFNTFPDSFFFQSSPIEGETNNTRGRTMMMMHKVIEKKEEDEKEKDEKGEEEEEVVLGVSLPPPPPPPPLQVLGDHGGGGGGREQPTLLDFWQNTPQPAFPMRKKEEENEEDIDDDVVMVTVGGAAAASAAAPSAPLSLPLSCASSSCLKNTANEEKEGIMRKRERKEAEKKEDGIPASKNISSCSSFDHADDNRVIHHMEKLTSTLLNWEKQHQEVEEEEEEVRERKRRKLEQVWRHLIQVGNAVMKIQPPVPSATTTTTITPPYPSSLSFSQRRRKK